MIHTQTFVLITPEVAAIRLNGPKQTKLVLTALSRSTRLTKLPRNLIQSKQKSTDIKRLAVATTHFQDGEFSSSHPLPERWHRSSVQRKAGSTASQEPHRYL